MLPLRLMTLPKILWENKLIETRGPCVRLLAWETILINKHIYTLHMLWLHVYHILLIEREFFFLPFWKLIVIICKSHVIPLHKRMLSAKFGWNWPNGYWEDFCQCLFTISLLQYSQCGSPISQRPRGGVITLPA